MNRALLTQARDALLMIGGPLRYLEQDKAIAALDAELAKPEPEPVSWVHLQKMAQAQVESSPLWKRFIDGNPLSNDISCWMATYAQSNAYLSPPSESEAMKLLREMQWSDVYSEYWAPKIDAVLKGTV